MYWDKICLVKTNDNKDTIEDMRPGKTWSAISVIWYCMQCQIKMEQRIEEMPPKYCYGCKEMGKT